MVRCLLEKTRKGRRKGMPAEETVCIKLMGSSVSGRSSPVAGALVRRRVVLLMEKEREWSLIGSDKTLRQGLTGEKLWCAGGIKQLCEEEGCDLAGVIQRYMCCILQGG